MVFSTDMEEHRDMVKNALAILHQNNLHLKPEKCEFENRRVEYLALVVNKGTVEMDAVNVEGVRKWMVPGIKNKLHQFLSTSTGGSSKTLQALPSCCTP